MECRSLLVHYDLHMHATRTAAIAVKRSTATASETLLDDHSTEL
jgi:hypothetical protein